MSCVPTPTATEYGLVTTYTPSTSYSQSGANTQVQVTTIVQQSCVASGTISGSSVGCLSSTQITQVNTIGGGGQATLVPIVVNVPVTESQATQTLFAPCSGGGATSSQSSSASPLTTSVLVQTTFPPSTVVEASSTTLENGSVVQTVVTAVTTLPPTAVYVPTTSLSSATLQSNTSHGSGTNVAPIIGGVLGGFLGLIAIVGSFWWLCRRRRSWDDIFEKGELQNDDAWAPTAGVRDSHRSDSGAEPKPYQYGLIGRVVPPAAAGEPVRSSRYDSVGEHSATHSRQTSLSATPLLQTTRSGSSRPSTSGSIPTIQTQPGPRVRSPVTNTEIEPRSLSMASYSSTSMGPLLDGQSTPTLLSNWAPNTDGLTVPEPLDCTGSPVSSVERRVLQIVNDGPPSPADSVVPGARRTSSEPSSDVVIHTDGGPVTELDVNPPAYSR